MIEQDCKVFQPVLKGLEESEGVDMLSPFSTLLFDTPLDSDDVDDSLEDSNAKVSISASSTNVDGDIRIEVEDSLGELAVADIAAVEQSLRTVSSKIVINGKETAKARALS